MGIIEDAKKSIELQKQRFEIDTQKYTKEIHAVLLLNGTDPNEQRKVLGRIFIESLK
jgi:hypothetical protein